MDLKYLKNVFLFLIGGILALLLAFYLFYHLSNGFTDVITTVSAEVVEREQARTLDGYLFREERVLFASGSGEVSYLCEDGTKLAKGDSCAKVYGESDPTVSEQIRQIEERILVLKKSNEIAGKKIYDASGIDRQIETLRGEIQTELLKGNTEFAARKKDELLVLLNRRAIIAQSVKNYDAQIKALEKEKMDFLSSLSSSKTLKAPVSGSFYASADGYETLFTVDALETLTPAGFEALISSDPVDNEGKNAVGTLVTDYHWYTVCRVESASLRFYRVGSTYTVVFPYNEDIRIPMVLSRVITGIDSDFALLVFDSTETPGGFRFLRMQSVRIVQENEDGIRVPIGAVHNVDGVNGVYVLDSSIACFRRIEILLEEDGCLICGKYDKNRKNAEEYLRENEMIITEGKDLYDGKVLQPR